MAETPKKTGWPASGGPWRSGRRGRVLAFIFLPYFQHPSVSPDKCAPRNTAELQHPTGCILHDPESEVQSPSCVTHSPPLPYLFL